MTTPLTCLTAPVYFVTGIDTDCGKTIATGYLCKYLNASGLSCITQKLIQTGCTGISEDICTHRDIEQRPLTEEDLDGTTCPLVFSYPCSPHMATAIDRRPLELDHARRSTRLLAARYDCVLVEGAGGLMVPLEGAYLTRDYICEEQLPVLLVTTAKLGSINHTLLSIEAIVTAGLTLSAIIYNTGIATDARITDETRTYLQGYLRTALPETAWIELPPLDIPT